MKGAVMHRYLIAGLLIAIGTVVSVGQAQAQSVSRYCYYNPDDPNCDDDEPRYYRPDRDEDPAYDDGQDDEPVYVAPRPRRYVEEPVVVSRCDRVRSRLERQGYRRLRALDCEGTSYKFRAVNSSGRSVVIRIRSDGRIIAVSRL
jgi:hypothetical protein